MNFLIISHTSHYKIDNLLYAYAAYVREMNIWLKYVDDVRIIAPVSKNFDKNINLAYQRQDIAISEVPAFSLIGFREQLSTLLKLPKTLKTIYSAMQKADHIHLRCPGNMGLLGCIVQILFPKKAKTAKYAGNWDPKAKQPWTYNLQKWILKNTFLTRNMQVLVYGNWPKETKNIKSFFTATYRKNEIQPIKTRNYTQNIHFCFVGSLVKGKQPFKALQLIQDLRQEGIDAVLHFYGNGVLKEELEQKIKAEQLGESVFVYGNQPKEKVQKALYYSHFMVLPSQSEGWPKAVAEAMFWGCIPVVPRISCVPWMLAEGQRGILMNDQDIPITVRQIKALLQEPQKLGKMAQQAAHWSQEYTLDKFEEEIKKLL